MNWGNDASSDDESGYASTEGGHDNEGHDNEPSHDNRNDTAGDDQVTLFDVEELNVEWSEWLPGVDYTAAIHQAKSGELVLRGLLRRIGHHGSRVRTQALCTRGGEPVVRADLHPDSWREVAGLVADGERYRHWMTRGGTGR